MPSETNCTLDMGGGASSGSADNMAIPSRSTIGESNGYLTLRIQSSNSQNLGFLKSPLARFQSPERPAAYIPNSIHRTSSTTPRESEITRSSNYATKPRRTIRCYRDQKRSSESLADPAQGPKSQKRRMVSEGKESADEDTHGTQPTQLLACPFSKLDGNRYHGCLKFELRRPKDVKQHISRKHLSPEFYCARCWQIFPDRGKQDDHARVAVCAVQPKPLFEGISDEQKYRLKRSGGRGATPEQQWFDIWDILFPGKQKPSSIYLGNVMEETLSYIRNRCQGEDLENMISTIRERRGEVVDAELVKDVVAVALDWFHKVIDSTPAGCESGPVETDSSSISDTSSSSASIHDLEFRFEGSNSELPWSVVGFPSTNDLGPVGPAMTEFTPYHELKEGLHLEHLFTPGSFDF